MNHMIKASVLVLTMAFGGACDMGVELPDPAYPRSLEGVEIDGQLSVDQDGHFVFDEQSRAFFDHFLAAEGEVDDGALHARVWKEIEARMAGEAEREAWEAFHGYLDYRREAASLVQDPEAAAGGERAMVLALSEIRMRTVGDVAGVPDEGSRLSASVRLQGILRDSTLSTEAKRAQLLALRQRVEGPAEEESRSHVLTRIHEALAEIPVDDVDARRAALEGLVEPEAVERWLALEERRRVAAEG